MKSLFSHENEHRKYRSVFFAYYKSFHEVNKTKIKHNVKE